jgi:hypothetical protein
LSDHPNVFSTRSVTLATWFEYAHELELRLIRYDPATQQFHFWDPKKIAQSIIDGLNKVDPRVNLERFIRTRKRVLSNKLRLDSQYHGKAVKRG